MGEESLSTRGLAVRWPEYAAYSKSTVGEVILAFVAAEALVGVGQACHVE
jgi:hypothetical protein